MSFWDELDRDERKLVIFLRVFFLVAALSIAIAGIVGATAGKEDVAPMVGIPGTFSIILLLTIKVVRRAIGRVFYWIAYPIIWIPIRRQRIREEREREIEQLEKEKNEITAMIDEALGKK